MASGEHYEPYEQLAPALLRSELRGKVALVTGGGYGIGRSIAQSFAEAGVARIILIGRTETKLKDTANDLSASFQEIDVVTMVADITSKEDVQHIFESCTKYAPDILINNAGYLSTPAEFLDADFDDYWNSFMVNVYGTMLFTQSFLRHRKAYVEAAENSGNTPSPAVVVTVNSMGAFLSMPKFSSYCSNKLALARWTELLSIEIPEEFARFVSVHPGAVDSSMGNKSGMIDQIKSGAAQLSLTNPKLTGDFIVWLTSRDAEFLNGRFVSVNTDIELLLSNKKEIIEKGMYSIRLSQ
ncbi:NAD(P)-binding protein [Aspergillus eucalypticola CBS 122712]|uniref:NAD(P)-binding protein n=1 Tax=Aspergillus eucalypticola (strain CBS 122712 / IBT 29274) TaxID=1448314 RepID=A0A317VYW8_ASPEC|nr:NAD(P)-binding protein [Aspergillus eucalypticola CBS 122712]PWY78975.1 NAD(P)-binding protein [Aspergillus eucalypticola CBS 122712]